MFILKNPLLDEEGSGAVGGPPADAGAPPAADTSAAPTDNWRESLPQGVRDWQEVETAKSADDFYKQMEHYRSAYGRSIRVPGEDAGPDDRAKFLAKMREAAPELVPAPDLEDAEAMNSLYATLGRPETADDYRMPEVAQQADAELLKVYKDSAHAAGLSQQQMEAVMGAFMSAQDHQIQAQQARLAEGNTLLQQEWGLAADRNKQAASTVAERFGFTEDVVNAITSGAMGAENVRAFYAMAQATGSEGVQIGAERGAASAMLTPDEARLQIQEIMNNKDHAYWNVSSPAHKSARKKMRDLHVMAQGNNNREVSLQAQTAGAGGAVEYGK